MRDITTIKLSKDTKGRIEKLRLYNRESYEDIVKRMLEILNLCVKNPERAKLQLIKLHKKKKQRGV